MSSICDMPLSNSSIGTATAPVGNRHQLSLPVRRSSLLAMSLLVAITINIVTASTSWDVLTTLVVVTGSTWALHRWRLDCMLAVGLIYLPAAARPLGLEAIGSAGPLMSSVGLLFPIIAATVIALVRFLSFRRIPLHLALLAFSSLLFASGSAYLGYSAGLESWSRALYLAVTPSTFLVGLSVKHAHMRLSRVWRVMLPVLVVLAATPLVSGHVKFVLAGIVGTQLGFGLVPHGGMARAPLPVVLGLGLLYLQSTFTIIFILAFGVLLGVLYASRQRRALRWAMNLGLVVGVVATSAIAFFASPPQQSLAQIGPTAYEQASATSRVELKLWADRYPLWSGIAQQIDGTLVAPSGRSAELNGYPNQALGRQEWRNGAHNVYLEAIWVLGSLGGISIALLVVSSFLFAARRVSLVNTTADPASAHALSLALLATVLGGVVTGQFILEATVGVPLWFTLGFLSRPVVDERHPVLK